MLWIAFKLVSLQCTNNLVSPNKSVSSVVNCFQISIFAVHEQPILFSDYKKIVVNCFQISIFAVHEQLIVRTFFFNVGCELLSN